MMKFNPKEQQGISLIIVFFILILIGSVAMYSTRATQARIENLRADKTVLEVTQLLEGGLAYFVLHNDWPNNIGAMVGDGILPPAALTAINPWSTNQRYIINSEYDAFTVTTTLTSATPQQTKQMTARVPNGVPLGSNVLRARVARPGTKSARKDPATGKYQYYLGGYVLNMGVKFISDTSRTFTIPTGGTCRPGYAANLSYGIQSMKSDSRPFLGVVFPVRVPEFLQEFYVEHDITVSNPAGHRITYKLLSGAMGTISGVNHKEYGTARISYIVTCVPTMT